MYSPTGPVKWSQTFTISAVGVSMVLLNQDLHNIQKPPPICTKYTVHDIVHDWAVHTCTHEHCLFITYSHAQCSAVQPLASLQLGSMCDPFSRLLVMSRWPQLHEVHVCVVWVDLLTDETQQDLNWGADTAEMLGWMHPNYMYGLVTILLDHDPLPQSVYPMITQTYPVMTI